MGEAPVLQPVLAEASAGEVQPVRAVQVEFSADEAQHHLLDRAEDSAAGARVHQPDQAEGFPLDVPAAVRKCAQTEDPPEPHAETDN